MDELLLRRAKSGDPEAFERLMEPLEQLVWRVCWHYTGNREAAEDCGQEAMIRIWRSLGSYRGDCALESWVYRIAANCSLDFLRKAGRIPETPLEPMKEEGFDPPDPSPGTEEQVLRKEEYAGLREAVASLPEEQRDALVLTQLEGKSYEEAARLLSVTEGTVKSRVNRARSRLREFIRRREELSFSPRVQRSEGTQGSRGSSEQRKERRGRL